MSGTVEKSLADRAEAILRSDRQSLVLSRRRRQVSSVLLTIVPGSGPTVDLLDDYLQSVADTAGLQYVRQCAAHLEETPSRWLDHAFLLLADMTGRNENVVANVYEALRAGRRVLLAACDPADLPPDLASVPSVVYSLEEGGADELVRMVRSIAWANVGDFVPLV